MMPLRGGEAMDPNLLTQFLLIVLDFHSETGWYT